MTTGLFLFASKKELQRGNKGNDLVPLYIQFDNVVGDQPLQLDRRQYVTAAGDSFTVSQLQYFISNISLERANGKSFVVNQDDSYFLVQEQEPGTRRIKVNVPPADYRQLSFILGVDSLRNTMHVSRRTGVLDPSSSMDNGMYWSWNSGYIFFKMEGDSPAAPVDPAGNQKFRFHVGGFGGYKAKTFNNIKTITLDLRKAGVVRPRKNNDATIFIKADLLKVFGGDSTVKIAEHPSVMFSQYSVNIANNYAKMFTHARTQN
jgi:hypothetical protein